MIRSARSKIINNSYLKAISEKTQINPETIVVLFFILLALALNSTFIGPFLNNIVCLILPLQESLLILRSPSPNVKDMKKTLIVLTLYGIISVFEFILKKTIPLYSAFKMAAMICISLKPEIQVAVCDGFFKTIPDEILGSESGIDSAIQKAAKSAEKKIDDIKNSVETKFKKNE